jgi:hypothetical protein
MKAQTPTAAPHTIVLFNKLREVLPCAFLKGLYSEIGRVNTPSPNGLRYLLVGGTKQRYFAGTVSKPRKLLENARPSLSRVNAVLAAGKDSSLCRLEQLYRIAVRVFHLNLFATRTNFHLISKVHPFLFKVGNACRQIFHLKNYSIPASWLLLTSIGHAPRARSTRTAENQLEITNGDLTERGQVLVI